MSILRTPPLFIIPKFNQLIKIQFTIVMSFKIPFFILREVLINIMFYSIKEISQFSTSIESKR